MKYKCGHETDGVIILDSNILSMTMYLQWAEGEGNLESEEECFDCFLKRTGSKNGSDSLS